MSVSIQGALDNLVGQFSSALDCYRELVQNAIDAGSPSVDVWTEFIPSDDSSRGTIAIHVDDYGEGMDEAIIDSQLTRLFSSTKENDLTKIGKFGIGFVSVFALQPKAVLIHTGRGGEYWEVLFNEDRSFTKTAVDTPMEGTQITLFIEGDDHRYRELAESTRKTLRKWCRFSETEIFFEDRSDPDSRGPIAINEPFVAHGDLEVTVEQPGTLISMARTAQPTYGFFNRGLTLLETNDAAEALGRDQGRLGKLSFVIKSRYLEHTLSRETIVKDRNYEKAIHLLLDVANGPLLDKLVAHIRDIAGQPDWSRKDRDSYSRAVRMLASEPTGAVIRHEHESVLRTLDGGAVSLSAVWDTLDDEGRIFLAPRATKLTTSLLVEGTPVLLAGPGLRPLRTLLVRYLLEREARTILGRVRSGLDYITSTFTGESMDILGERAVESMGRTLCDPHSVFVAVKYIKKPDARMDEVLDEVREALRGVGVKYDAIVPCRLQVPEVDPPMFLTGKKLTPLMARPAPPRVVQSLNEERAARKKREKKKKKGVAAVNVDHPHIRYLSQLPSDLRSFSVYGLAKMMLLQRDEFLTRDSDLVLACQGTPP